MMDWILDIYDQETYRTAIIMITSFIITLFLVCIFRVLKFKESDHWVNKLIESLPLFVITVFLWVVPDMYLKEKIEKRREVQLEQQQSGK